MCVQQICEVYRSRFQEENNNDGKLFKTYFGTGQNVANSFHSKGGLKFTSNRQAFSRVRESI